MGRTWRFQLVATENERLEEPVITWVEAIPQQVAMEINERFVTAWIREVWSLTVASIL